MYSTEFSLRQSVRPEWNLYGSWRVMREVCCRLLHEGWSLRWYVTLGFETIYWGLICGGWGGEAVLTA